MENAARQFPSESAFRLSDFLIIGGTMKGGILLYDYLCRHKKVEVAFRKEVHYFEPYNQKLSELLNRDFMWAG